MEISPAAYSGLQRLCTAAFFNHDPAKTYLAQMKFTAYFDDSGHPDDHNQPAVLIAGFVATEEQWLLFDQKWTQALREAGVSSGIFHRTRLETRNEDYTGWSDNRKSKLLDRLTNLIGTRTELNLCVIVSMDGYRRVNAEYALQECKGAPYAMAGRVIMEWLRQWQEKYCHENDPLLLVFEDGAKHKGDLIDLFHHSRFDCPTFRSKNCPGLQAADFLAWESFNAFRTKHVGVWYDALLNGVGKCEGMTEKDLRETCEEQKVPRREIISPNTDIVLTGQPKKIRRKTIG